jgi:hypothetical protein
MKQRIIYWTAVGIVSLMMIFSGYLYLTDPMMDDAFGHLGFPSYFRIELAVAKIIGAGVLLLPFVPSFLKEWAFAGFTITFISALIAHSASGDPVSVLIGPVIALTLLVVAYIYHKKLQSPSA